MADHPSMARLVQRWATAERAHSTEPPLSPPWPLRQPVSASDLVRLEDRLGVELPPSYRAFLNITSGTDPVDSRVIQDGGWEYGFLRPDDIGRFDELQPDNVAMWMSTADPEHVDHEPATSPAWGAAVEGFCGQCLPRTVLISQGERSRWVLLNPGVIDADGEWECWLLDPWTTGGRYRSFRTYLEARMMLLAPAAIGREDQFTITAALARDESRPERERMKALLVAIHQPRAVELLGLYLHFMMLEPLKRLLRDGLGAGAIVPVLAAMCVPPRPTQYPQCATFDSVVTTLVVSVHPDAIDAVRQVLRDVDSAHVSYTQELLIAADLSPYREEFWALWEKTGDPAYLLKIAYQGDDSVIETIRDFADNPREYQLPSGAHPQHRDVTRSRIECVLKGRAHPSD